ncbi:Iterative polyketide synthase CazM 11 [Phlyctema vagabunda]|uniref:Iterative polyketide synthase CazM 11 n=1 Tax=Phlyctema vagabunda TaxID=108571 RepID=A0ABR4PSK0_9HELO
MATISTTQPSATTILLFGPQVHTFDEASFSRLRSTLLDNPGCTWLLDVIFELPRYCDIISDSFPKLQNSRSSRYLAQLDSWFRIGDFTDGDFPLPSILLTPLVVIAQLAQYVKYLDVVRPDDIDRHDLCGSFKQDVETLGFCTGLLTALAVSSSSNESELKHYGAVAVRLAMLVGLLVDARDSSTSPHGESKSFSAAWNASETRDELYKILTEFPEAYISVLYDERRVTITTSKSTALSLIQRLKTAGVIVSEFGLLGRFHCPAYEEDMKSIYEFGNSQPAFQFPDASRLVLPTRSNSSGSSVEEEKLHKFALRSILVEQSNWYQSFAAVWTERLDGSESKVVSFGADRIVPLAFMRKLGTRIIQASELDKTVVGLPGRTLEPKNPLDDQIAVIGMSCKVAGAENLEEFWDLLCKGQSQHVEVPAERFGFETAWRENEDKKWFGNFVKDHDAFDHKFFKKSPREMASTDPQQRLMLQVAYQAVEQSGYFQSQNDKHIGCYIGMGNVEYEQNVGCHPANAFSATGNLKAFTAGKISHFFGWTGPGLTIDTACSASAVSIHHACKAILSGDCTAALAGGVAIYTNPGWYQNLAGASFLSPTGPCKPFDSKADGYCRGEGIGAVFLKRLSTAIAEGDQVLGVIASTAVYQNQNCTAITVPNAISLSGLFENVTRQAGLKPEQISVVEAHGTGTPVGDPAEYESIRRVFGGPKRAENLSLGSVKGLVGHTECASGVIALIKTLLMIREGAIPPQASFQTLNPSIETTPADKIEIAKTMKPWDVNFRAALINNYGASGSNASMVVTQLSKPTIGHKLTRELSETKLPFWICGFDDQNLRVYSSRLRQFINSKVLSRESLSLANLSFNIARQSNRSLNRALVFNSSSIDELEKKLVDFENGDASITPIAAQPKRPVILCFGGQVSTFVGLDRQIYDNVSVLKHHLDECNTVCEAMDLGSIYPKLFQTKAVEDIVKLQTILFAMQYACAKSWIDCGVHVSAVVGHSFGELTALCVSGVLCLRDAIRLITGRARIIKSSWGEEKGSMMAVEGDLDDVKRLLAQSGIEDGDRAATIACYNGPRSFTLAGSIKAIDKVEQTVIKSSPSSLRGKRLNVTNAFHSTLVDHLMDDLEKVTAGIVFRAPKIPVERATEDGAAGLTSSFVADHMRNPVYFNQAVQRLSSRYPKAVWLEAGSGSTITKIASRALGGPKGSCFQSMSITGSDNALQSLADATTNLWKEGLNFSFWMHHTMQTSEYTPLLLPPYQFEKSRHWLELKKPQLAIAETKTPAVTSEEIPKDLWTFVGYQDDAKRSARFRINTMIKKFEEYISGHKMVQTAPLCPSTLQLDIVIEALMSLRAELTASASNLQPQLQGLENHAPLCFDPSRLVWLDVESKDADTHDWEWRFVSNTAEDNSATTLHASGKVIFRSTNDEQLQSEFTRYERIVGHQRCLQLLDSNEADDIMQGRNVYKTFAEIVDYGEIYRGVQKVVGKGTESAGRIVKKYSAESWLDTPLADCFAQVAGIFVNCMTERGSQDVFISNKIGRWIRSPKMRTGDSRPEVWDVFVYHDRQSDKEYLSDVFVFDSRNGALVEMILGLKFHRVSKAGLSKVLSRFVPGGTKSQPIAAAPSVAARIDASRLKAQPLVINTSTSQQAVVPKKKKKARPDISESLRSLLANISGIEPGEIENTTGLADIGIDSLMGMELVREVETAFKVSLKLTQLNDVVDFQDLIKCIQSTLGPLESDGGSDSDEMPSEIEDTESQGNDTPREPLTPTSPKPRGRISEFLAEQLGIAESDVELEAHLSDLGVDSLLSIELVSDISARFGYKHLEGIVFEELTVKELEGMINSDTTRVSHELKGSGNLGDVTQSSKLDSAASTSSKKNLEIPRVKILEAFEESKKATDQYISEHKLADYANLVWPKQTELTIAYIVEAFDKLGCSLASATSGQALDRIEYLPQHERFVEQLYAILEKEARLIDIDGTRIIRTVIAPPQKTSEVLFEEIIRSYPDYVIDNKLMKLTGSKLAECLSGQSDGIQLIFGSAESRNLVSSWYCESPINRAFLKQMEGFIKGLITRLPTHGPIKILEMGAGTGGTTAGMAPLLASLDVEVEYTFTDLSPSLVAAARRRFKEYPFMKFMVHDIEMPASTELFHSQHIVIANNCVHATHDLAISTKSIHSVLRPDGFLTMLEMTAIPSWIDLIFGVLEGWWLFDDGRKHALTPESKWQEVMQSVGYGQVDWTEGSRPEANVQRILVGLASGSRYARQPLSKPQKSLTATDCQSRQAVIDEYIRKYTQDFQNTTPSSSAPSVGPPGDCVLLTGATGSLGSHLVAHFAELDTVHTVICLNRRNGTDPLGRQRKALETRGIALATDTMSKLKVFETDTAKPWLGLSHDEYQKLISMVTHIVHNAWPMSIKRPIRGFESQFQVMRNLIDLSNEISCSRVEEFRVGFQFISSIATVGYYPLWSGTARVPEERMVVKSILPVGYGDAKYVCEKMLDETLHRYPKSFRPMVVRLGQIAGSQTSGYWNPMEHISFLVKSSQTLKALPQLEGDLSWCPANSIAATLGDLLIRDTTPYPIYHIENPVRQPWTEMMRIMADALDIPQCNILPFDEWVSRVRQFPGSVEDNPASKLVEFFDGDFIRMSCGELILDTTKAKEHSKTLASLGPVSAALATKYVKAWREMGFLN